MRGVVGAAVLLLAACSLNADYGGTQYRCDDGVCPPGFHCVGDRCVADGVPDARPIDAPELPPDAARPDATPPAPPDAARPDAMPAESPPWWDPMFAQRRPLVITNLAGAPLPVGFQIRWLIDLHAQGLSNTDSDTFRIVRWDGSTWTDLNRVIDDTNDNVEALWIALPIEIPAMSEDRSFYLYYDHPSTTLTAPALSDTIFTDFFDAFNGSTLDSTRWNSVGTISQGSGALELDINEDVGSIATFGPGFAVDFGLRMGSTWSPRFWGGFQHTTSLDDIEPWILWISRSDVPQMIWPEFLAYESGSTVAHAGPMRPLPLSERYIYSVDRFAQKIQFRYEHLVVDEYIPVMPYTTPLRIRFTNDGTERIYIEFVRIRRTIDPYPETALLAPEMAP